MKTIFAYALSRVSNKKNAEDLAGGIALAILKSVPKIRDDNAFGYISLPMHGTQVTAASLLKQFLLCHGANAAPPSLISPSL